MRKLILIIALVLFGLNNNAQNVYIPDPNFKNFLLNNSSINTNADTAIQLSEAVSYNGSILCQTQNISDLKGIESFINITSLQCQNNFLDSLNLSLNTSLTFIRCNNNTLSSLVIGNNSALVNLQCQWNQIESLDLTGASNLQQLYADNNLLTSIDLNNNVNLTHLIIAENQISAIDLTNNPNISILNLGFNRISTIDLTLNNVLTVVVANHQVDITTFEATLVSFSVRNGNNNLITAFDATGNAELNCIEVDDAIYSENNWPNISSTTYFSENCSASTIENTYQILVSVFPNPANDKIIYESIYEDFSSITIYDFSGKQIENYNFSPTNFQTLQLSNFPNGMYFYSIDNGKAKGKFIIEK